MPVIADSSFPDFDILQAEGLVCTPNSRAAQQAQPLELLAFNSMPNKARTAADIARLVGASGQPINLTFVRPRVMEQCEHDFIDKLHDRPTHVAAAWQRHFDSCGTLDDVRGKTFHGAIISGAPLGDRPVQSLSYRDDWSELFADAPRRFGRVVAVCLSAMGAAQYYHGIEKEVLSDKLSGVYPQHILTPHDPLVQGLGSHIKTPVSRFSRLPDEAVKRAGIQVLAAHAETGAGILRITPDVIGLTVHPEYTHDTLAAEYANALRARNGQRPQPPVNYFHHNDPAAGIAPNSWKQGAQVLGANLMREVRQAAIEKGLLHETRFNLGAAANMGRVAALPLRRHHQPS